METVPDALAGIAKRFGQAVESHGATPSGVGWSSPQAQSLRFQELLAIFANHPPGQPFTAFDFGCGYGALCPLLAAIPQRPLTGYTGYDISPAMIETARQRYGIDPRFQFQQAALPRSRADYGFVSGTFNYRGQASAEHWQCYLRATLDQLLKKCDRGLAINFLRLAPGASRRSPVMHYSTPSDWLDFLTRHPRVLSLTLRDGYLPDDFTVLIQTRPLVGA
jgi:SAM-dependent methyltransferase